MPTDADSSSFHRLLKHLRAQHHISQLELAIRLGVSQRHVSFVELGRTRPSKALLRAWLEVMNAPDSTVNMVMNAAGYSVVAGDQPVPAAPTPEADGELSALLDAHEPFPAFVFTTDRYITRMNLGARRMWKMIMPAYWDRVERERTPLDMIDALADPDGFLSRMRDARDCGAGLLALLRAEVWLRPGLTARVERLAAALSQRYGPIVESPDPPQLGGGVPVRAFRFDLEDGPLTLIAAQSVVGLPQNLTLNSPRVETWMPADEETRRHLTLQATSADTRR